MFRHAPPLRPGSVVAVVAPSSGFDENELFRGLAWLATRYRLSVDERIVTRQGYLAGADAARASVLARAMIDPAVEAIVCARGGYGAMRILDELPWDDFALRPKKLVGFSDVTALHVVANARGVATVHGPNVTGLGRSITAAERASLIATLEDGTLASWSNLHVLVPGQARGPVIGGNLALVSAMAAAGRLVVPKGAFLLLEDLNERPYRIDRMLTSLLLGGHLATAGAIVFGGFTQCDAGPDGVSVRDVLVDRTRMLGVPVVAGAPFGHGAPNHAFVLGREAVLHGDRLDWC
ncbi:MAG TPA: LD-carboxypeptidase [Labilithrix sp.]|nr:LD-carboxypeptidase [Labilithrix sp.]